MPTEEEGITELGVSENKLNQAETEQPTSLTKSATMAEALLKESNENPLASLKIQTPESNISTRKVSYFLLAKSPRDQQSKSRKSSIEGNPLSKSMAS